MNKIIEWKGTPGVGDYMMGLNIAHNYSFKNNTSVDFLIHWYHDKDYVHHFEDPETIVDRLEFSHNFYKDQDRVKVYHQYDSPDTELWVKRYRGIEYSPLATNRINSWVHRPTSFLPTNNRKIVMWRPAFNAEIPRAWKNIVDNYTWDYIIKLMATVYDYDIVELSYRTPISEVYYHISTCDFVVCYDGMWHYVAKNFMKPMIVFSDNVVTQFHTPNAIMLGKRQIREFFNDFETNYGLLSPKLETYKLEIREIL